MRLAQQSAEFENIVFAKFDIRDVTPDQALSKAIQHCRGKVECMEAPIIHATKPECLQQGKSRRSRSAPGVEYANIGANKIAVLEESPKRLRSAKYRIK